MNYLIVYEMPNGFKTKELMVLIEHNNLRRQNRLSIPLATNSDDYLQTYGTVLWSQGSHADDALWLKHEEKQFVNLYQAVIRAGVQAARQNGATLADVSSAMETLIAADPKKSLHLTKLQAMATAATAAERDRFFLLCAFLFLSKTLTEDGS